MKEQTPFDQFKDDVTSCTQDYIVSKWIMERLPYIFNNDFRKYIEVKNKIAKLIDVDSRSIIFVGSSSIGFSLNPYKSFKVFDDKSDIDIAIISHYYFDVAWHDIRNIDITKYHDDIKKSLIDHKQRLIYYGTIATDKILGLLSFGNKWLAAIDAIKKEDILRNRDINFRLYMDNGSLRAYHINNINKNMSYYAGVNPEDKKI